MGQACATGLSNGDVVILAGLFLALTVAMTVGAARGQRRGPVRALASLVALACSLAAAWLFGAGFGRLMFAGTRFPWLLRGATGALVLGSLVWLAVFGWMWWRGRAKNPSGEPEHPVTGAIVGCWVGIVWFSVGLALTLALAGLGETFMTVGGGRAPAVLRWPLRVKRALAASPSTEAISRFDPVPERPKRLLRKELLVLNDPRAFKRLQSDESVRAIAAHPAFYPLVSDPEIRELVRRHDAAGLLAHPRVIALLEDESFQRRLEQTDVEAMLDRALGEPEH